MKITNVYVERTFNLGNYESLKVGFEANICESDKPLEVTAELERMAFQHYENTKAKKDVAPQQKQAPAPTTTKTPAQIANENQARREAQPKTNPAPSIPQENICPNCGGKKQPQYPICYSCHMKEQE
jgi:hypothetical protein